MKTTTNPAKLTVNPADLRDLLAVRARLDRFLSSSEQHPSDKRELEAALEAAEQRLHEAREEPNCRRAAQARLASR
jgi:hypothetical protein